jgi:hypothetical protein
MFYRISISWCCMNLHLMLSSCTDKMCLLSLSTKISIKRKVCRLWAVYSMAPQWVITSSCVGAMRDKYPDQFHQYHVFVPSRLGKTDTLTVWTVDQFIHIIFYKFSLYETNVLCSRNLNLYCWLVTGKWDCIMFLFFRLFMLIKWNILHIIVCFVFLFDC